MIVVNVQNESDFVMLANVTMRDRRLSAEARGVLAYLLTHSAKFEVTFDTLKAEFSLGRDKLQKIISELKKWGYLKVTAKQKESGLFAGWNWTVYGKSQEQDFTLTNKTKGDEPDGLPEKPSDGKTETPFNRQSENPADNKEESVSDEEESNLKKKNSLSPGAGALKSSSFDEASEIVGGVTETEDLTEIQYTDKIISHLKIKLNEPFSLSDEREWQKAIEWAYLNEKSAEQAIEVYNLLEEIKARKKGKWSITPAFWKRSIAKIETLRLEAVELRVGKEQSQNGAQTKNADAKPKSTNAGDRNDQRISNAGKLVNQLLELGDRRKSGLSG